MFLTMNWLDLQILVTLQLPAQVSALSMCTRRLVTTF